jgi:hypothetical protein
MGNRGAPSPLPSSMVPPGAITPIPPWTELLGRGRLARTPVIPPPGPLPLIEDRNRPDVVPTPAIRRAGADFPSGVAHERPHRRVGDGGLGHGRKTGSATR